MTPQGTALRRGSADAGRTEEPDGGASGASSFLKDEAFDGIVIENSEILTFVLFTQ